MAYVNVIILTVLAEFASISSPVQPVEQGAEVD